MIGRNKINMSNTIYPPKNVTCYFSTPIIQHPENERWHNMISIYIHKYKASVNFTKSSSASQRQIMLALALKRCHVSDNSHTKNFLKQEHAKKLWAPLQEKGARKNS